MKSFPRNLSLVGLCLFAFNIPISFVPAEFGIGSALLGWLAEGLFNKCWAPQWHPFLAPMIFYFASLMVVYHGPAFLCNQVESQQQQSS